MLFNCKRCGTSRGRTIATVFCATVVLALATAAQAVEVTVQNDTIGDQVPVGDFVAGEEAAVFLASPCNGNIVALQIVWGAVSTLR